MSVQEMKEARAIARKAYLKARAKKEHESHQCAHVLRMPEKIKTKDTKSGIPKETSEGSQKCPRKTQQ
jgi:hypothetical protein